MRMHIGPQTVGCLLLLGGRPMFVADAQDVGSGEVRLLTQRAEDRPLIIVQIEDGVELGHLAIVHDNDPVVVGWSG